MAQGAFDTLHPAVCVAYATCALVLTMAAFQPVLVGVALASAVSLRALLGGWRAAARALAWQLPLVALIALANPLFAAMGSTELFRVGTHAFYLESLAYGACMGAMLVAVMAQFSCASAVLSSDKVMAVTGRKLPTVTLVVSMALRLVPRFTRCGREISVVQQANTAAQGARGAGMSPCSSNGSLCGTAHWAVPVAAQPARGNAPAPHAVEGKNSAIRRGNGGTTCSLRARVADYARLISVLMGWSMEDSLEMADAMRSRGWASGARRTTYRRWRFTLADGVVLGAVLALAALCGVCAFAAVTQFRFYPVLSTLVTWWGYAPYALFFFLPHLVLLGDHLRWMR